MSNLYFWRDLYGNVEQFAPYIETIQKFIEGKRGGLNFEKLNTKANPPIYSIRVNDSTRILLTLYRQSICLLDVILNHDYAKSSFLRNPKKVHDFFQEMIDSKSIIWEESSDNLLTETITTDILKPLDYYQGQFIHLNTEQEKILSAPLPAIISGPAGSGKTTAIMSLLINKLQTSEGRLLYLTRSQALVTSLKTMWQNDYPTETRLDFKTYDELYTCIDHEDEFKSWITRGGAGSALTPEQTWQEMRIRACYDEDTQYLELGKRQSLLDDDGKTKICDLFKKFNTHLSQTDSSLSHITTPLPYELVVVDEAQDLSHTQLKNLFFGSHHNIVFLLGQHQNLFDNVSKLDYLKILFHENDIRPEVIHLPISYRSGEHIVKLNNGLIVLKQLATGGGSDKAESLMQIADELKDQGQFELRATTAIDELKGDHPHQAIITRDELKDEAKTIFNSTLVFTPAEIKGLEFHTIVLWKLLSDPRAKVLAKQIPKEITETDTLHRPKKGEEHPEFLHICDTWITAASRAKQRLIWCDDPNHRINPIYQHLKKYHAKAEIISEPSSNWAEVFEQLIQHGAIEQAQDIYIKHLGHSQDEFSALMSAHTPTTKAKDFTLNYRALQDYLLHKKSKKPINILFQDEEASFLEFICRQDDGIDVLQRVFAKNPHLIPENVWFSSFTILKTIWQKKPNFSIEILSHHISAIPETFLTGPDNFIEILHQNSKGMALLLEIFCRNKAKYIPLLLSTPSEARVKTFIALIKKASALTNPKADLKQKLEKLTPSVAQINYPCFIQFVTKAMQKEDTWILKLFASTGIAGHTIFIQSFNLLHLASINNKLKLVSIFCENKTYINEPSNQGISALCLASEYGHQDIVEYLSNQGANIHQADNKGFTPLHIATQVGNQKIVEFLCTKGANVNLATTDGYTPLRIACQNGPLGIVMFLSNKGANIHQADNKGFTPLHVAAQFGNQSIVKYLCDKGVNVNLVTANGSTPLALAIQYGHQNIVEFLFHQGAAIHQANKQGHSPLCLAVQNGHQNIVEFLCMKGADINQTDNIGYTPLTFAIQNGYPNIVEFLCMKGANVNLASIDGFSPLYIAIKNGHQKIVELLCHQGADVEQANNQGYRPLFTACYNGDLDIVKLLCDKGANIYQYSNQGYTPLYVAVQNGHQKIVEFLCHQGADVEQADNLGYTPLYVAVQNGHQKIVEFLCHQGANVHQSENYGRLPLYVACYTGNLDIVKFLYDKGANVNSVTIEGSTPLSTACRNGHQEIVEFLCAKGGNINHADNKGLTPLYVAIQNGHQKIVEFLCHQGADIHQADNLGYTPLYVAVQNGHQKIVEFLCHQGANVHQSENYGRSPLYLACYIGNLDIVKFLYDKGANVNSVTIEGNTPLSTACRNGHQEIVEFLCAKGGNINQADNKGLTPLYVACYTGDLDIVKLLYDKGANVNSVTIEGNTPLNIACYKGHQEIVEFLCTKGANVNQTAKNGLTPLHFAAEQGKLETVKFLYENGADLSVNNCEGKTAYDIAQENGHLDIADLLKQAISTTSTLIHGLFRESSLIDSACPSPAPKH